MEEKYTIDKKYKINSFGKYNKRVISCHNCDFNFYDEPSNLYNHIIGFCDSSIGTLAVVECPSCFEKWSFHAREDEDGGGSYRCFLYAIKDNENIHFKK